MAGLTLKLNDGTTVPWLAFGTGTALYSQNVEGLVSQALKAGFIHLDGAQAYKNEDTLGNAIVNSGIPREQLYVTTKLTKLEADQTVRSTLVESLKKSKVDYVNLFLIHSPVHHKERIEEVWKEMEACQKEGLTRSIGVSNFRIQDLERCIAAGSVIPAVNQIEYHPYLVDAAKPLLDFHKKHAIITAAYGGLTTVFRKKDGPADPVVARIRERLANERGKPVTDGQVLLKWLYQKDIIAVTTSTKEERVKEYLDTATVPDLTADEIKAIDDAGAGEHHRSFWNQGSQSHMDQN